MTVERRITWPQPTPWHWGTGSEIWPSQEEMDAALTAREVVWKRMLATGAILHKGQVKDAGRNDPCPCGSGVKYKKCHLR